jgi:hypothetical protein
MVDRAEEGVWITRVDEGGEQRTASEGEFGRAGGALLYLEPGVQAPETLRRSSYRCVWLCQVGESRKARYAHMSREAKGLWSWGSAGLAATGTVDSYSGEILRSL